ncbi:hypothetical protein HOY82DRAFT_469911, partial [Tuber indicum]
FLSKPIRVHLKCIGVIHQLPYTRCSFTIVLLKIVKHTDLDSRLPILFSSI